MNYKQRYYLRNADTTLRDILEKYQFEYPHKRVMVRRFSNILGIDTAHNLLNYSSQYFRYYLEYKAEIEHVPNSNGNLLYITI